MAFGIGRKKKAEYQTQLIMIKKEMNMQEKKQKNKHKKLKMKYMLYNFRQLQNVIMIHTHMYLTGIVNQLTIKVKK